MNMLARTSDIRKPNLACIVTLACVLLLGACTAKVQRTHTPRPGNKYARGFQITDTLGMKCVRVFAPWKTDSVMATYYVSEPLERLGASSATHIGMLAELGLLDKLAGMCNPEVSYHELPATCQHLGDAMQPDCERIIANGVQAMLYSTYSPSDQSAERMESVGIPVLYNNEWRESTPLARAEWIRFVAVFFDKLDLADSIFADVERKYNALKDQQAARDSRQSASIVSGLDFRGTWYVPAGGTYMGALFKDAGANYAFADDPRETSIPLTFEQALLTFADADATITAIVADEPIDVTLYDNDTDATEENASIISANDEHYANVTLSGRTLYKDGCWNTLCLPFDFVIEGSPLEDATIMVLDGEGSSFDNETGTLTLNFTDYTETVFTAGTACIVKWASGSDIENPVFNGAVIKNVQPAATSSSDNAVTFVGLYSPKAFTAEGDKTILYLGADDKLHYPNGEMTIYAFRSYFQLNNGLVCGEPDQSGGVNAFVLNFGHGNETAISLITYPSSLTFDAWYTIDGRKLIGKPTTKGIYINNGRKVVIK